MQKISILNLLRQLFAAPPACKAQAIGSRPADPFDHPAVQSMDLRALADLPFEREPARR